MKKEFDPHLVVCTSSDRIELVLPKSAVFDFPMFARQTHRGDIHYYSMAKDDHKMNQRLDESIV